MPGNSSDNLERWQNNTLDPVIRRFPERRESFITDSGIPIEPLYSPSNGNSAGAEIGYPGEYPYTRGVQPNMYRGRIWTMRQYSGYSTAADTNHRFRYLLEQGQTGLSVAFDLPTQIGYDSDSPQSRGEVGKVGVPICSLQDMETLFDGIPLDQVSTSMTINATASVLLCLYIASAKGQGVKQDQLNGTLQNDILKEYIARGHLFLPAPAVHAPGGGCLQILRGKYPQVEHHQHKRLPHAEAGATAVQELAFTFANAIAYVQAAVDAGLAVDDFAPRLSFFFVAQNNLLEEVAKYRAARRMWATIMKERFGAKDPRSMMLRFHTQTAGVTLTAQQPDNNVVRSTVQALAAILGGTQSLHVNSRDEALGLPTEESAQLSLRTQQIIAHESGVADVVDPLGGSWYVESLTDQLEQGALKYIAEIDRQGGSVTAIEQGYQVREIGESAYRHQREVDTGDRTVVGVNRYVGDAPPIGNLLRVDPEVARQQGEQLAKLRQGRDNQQVKASLARLEEVARSSDNTVPVTLECVENYCTLGEICQVFRNVFGEQQGELAF